MRSSSSASWAPHVLSLELKKTFSYRLDFWILFVVGTGTQVAVAYFLWKAIYQNQNATTMGGYSFHAIVFYYLFATFAVRISQGNDRGYISAEIYDGGLTRYLLYPLSFLGYKFVTHFAQQVVGTFQLLLAFALTWVLMGLPPDQNITVGSFLAGSLTCILAGGLYFLITTCLELVAFWQDVIWNLLVMLRFVVMLLGGATIPLSFFPEWGQRLVSYTPFPQLISFPVRTFLGQVGLEEWLRSVGVLSFWAIVFAFIADRIWKRGIRQYSGVGI